MALNYSQADARYKNIQKRSFETHLDHFLLRRLMNKQELVIDDEFIKQFQSFLHSDNQKVREEMINISVRLWKYSKPDDKDKSFGNMTMSEIDSQLKNWYKQNKAKELFDWYCDHFMTREQFRQKYGNDEKNRECAYCGIDEESIKAAIESDSLFSKRLFIRGRSMEIDRIEPNKGYEPENIVLCCYWCNNAKTDEFSYQEFKEIAMKIQEVWKKRGVMKI